jgi:hypothetical protein
MSIESSGVGIDGFFPHSYFHVGIVVPDLVVSMQELAMGLGLSFNEPHDSEYGGDRIRVAYARQGPPYYELIQGEVGSRWDTGAGSRMDHVGYFSHDLDADVAALEAQGLALDIDGREWGRPFTYHRAPAAGIRVELIAVDRRDRLLHSIQS